MADDKARYGFYFKYRDFEIGLAAELAYAIVGGVGAAIGVAMRYYGLL